MDVDGELNNLAPANILWVPDQMIKPEMMKNDED